MKIVLGLSLILLASCESTIKGTLKVEDLNSQLLTDSYTPYVYQLGVNNVAFFGGSSAWDEGCYAGTIDSNSNAYCVGSTNNLPLSMKR